MSILVRGKRGDRTAVEPPSASLVSALAECRGAHMIGRYGDAQGQGSGQEGVDGLFRLPAVV